MVEDQEWHRIISHFRNGFFARNPNPPQHLHEAFFDNLEQLLGDALENRPIEFVDLEDARREDSDDFGAALILAGGGLYRVRVRNEEIQVAFIGAPFGGIYREEAQFGNGQLLRTRITYEHPKLAELGEALGFIVLPAESKRYAPLRRRLRRWGRSGIRVWGARTL
jgi:hypothetical protein